MKNPMFGCLICNNVYLKMNKFSFLLIVFLFSNRLSAQPKGDFVSDIFVSSKNDSLPYQLIPPTNFDSTKNYPIILWLHGKGERGNDNKRQIATIEKWIFDSLANENRQAYLLAPQCSSNRTWSNYDKLEQQITFEKDTPLIQNSIIELLSQVQLNYPIDSTRIYIMGISMGGFGVFDMITRFPNRFAASIPICGGADPKKVKELKETPIWAFHGEKDNIVDKRHTIHTMNLLQDENHLLNTYPNIGHDVWKKAFKEPELLHWLFAQKRIKN